MRYLLLALLAVPAVDLALLLAIGRNWGVLAAVGFVAASGILGTALARSQLSQVIRSWREARAYRRVPEEGVVSGGLVLVGAALLVFPGVVTDALGLIFLLPPTRRRLAAWLRRSFERWLHKGQVRVVSYRTVSRVDVDVEPQTPYSRGRLEK
jgi:UPF0716 protein FxsA